MAIALGKLTNQVMMALQTTDAAYKKTVENSIAAIYSIIGEELDLDWLDSRDRYPLVLTANTSIYKLNRKEIHKIIAIENLEGNPKLSYLSPRQFRQKLLKGVDTSSITNPAWWTYYGRDGETRRIRIYPIPGETDTLYVHYLLEPLLSNLGYCPAIFTKCFIHGVKSLLSPPEELSSPGKRLRWNSITKDEDALFWGTLNYIKRKMREPGEDPPLYEADVHLTNQIDEANDFQ